MLVDFSVRNFLSFKDEVTFSMLTAKSVKDHEQEGCGESCNTIPVQHSDLKLLKVSAVYGANGSGKSNLLKAMSFFREMVLNSFEDDSILHNTRDLAFKFNIESKDEPSSFEMTFIIDDKRYRYGFEIFNESIESEWLFVKLPESTRESNCFKRNKQNITVNSKIFKGAGGLSGKTRYNTLFLSICALFNVEVCMLIKEWFRNKFTILSRQDDDVLHYTAKKYLNKEEFRKQIIEFIRVIGLGINDITIIETGVGKCLEYQNRYIEKETFSWNSYCKTSVTKDANGVEILSEHNRYGQGKLIDTVNVPFDIESQGTKKIFALLGPWFDAIVKGGVLLIDDFGASFHTHLSWELVKIFQSTFNKGAQLIFTTHDTNLLWRDLFRRDQIWFAEKNDLQGTELYSLEQFKENKRISGQKDPYINDYLLGKYGAVPSFGNLDQFIKEFSLKDN